MVVTSFALEPYDAGDVYGPGVTFEDIVEETVDATIVVVQVTPENPNVHYELGYAHALGKPAMLLAERGQGLPFDVTGCQAIFHENSIAGKRQAEENRRKHLIAILGR